jgi:hypothetical protein
VRCQYCDEEVRDAALVCRNCGQHLSLTVPLSLRIADLEQELSDVRAGNEALPNIEDDLQALRARRGRT